MNKFQGKTIIITGGATGIGRECSINFAKEGANVVVFYNNSRQKAEDLIVELNNKFNCNSICIKCDITDEQNIREAVKLVMENFKKIDVLVNNAGFAKFIPIMERTKEDWQKTLDINLVGHFLCIKYIAKVMQNNNEVCNIINISSTSGINTFDSSIADYDASKAGLITLTKNFAKALSPKIRVNAVAPGWIDTDMNKDLDPGFIEEESRQVFLKRFGKPDEIAKAVLFLASEDSSYTTGSVLVVDGGHN